jgi:plasmid maintenance system antidote protein VapI
MNIAAKRLDVDKGNLQRILSGQRPLTRAMLERLEPLAGRVSRRRGEQNPG